MSHAFELHFRESPEIPGSALTDLRVWTEMVAFMRSRDPRLERVAVYSRSVRRLGWETLRWGATASHPPAVLVFQEKGDCDAFAIQFEDHLKTSMPIPMKGQIHVIPAEPGTAQKLIRLESPIKDGELEDFIGGHIGIVPSMDTVIREDALVPCVAFCDVEGRRKNLPLNQYANAIWLQSLARKFRPGFEPGDLLVGTVVVVTGDLRFMDNLPYSPTRPAALSLSRLARRM